MLLGKRPRHPIKRTTSMTEFTLDLNTTTTTTTNGEVQPSDLFQNPFGLTQKPAGYDGVVDQRLLTTVSPRNPRRNSVELAGTGHFLRACNLCKRRLVPGRDIYMYRYFLYISLSFSLDVCKDFEAIFFIWVVPNSCNSITRFI